MESGVHFSLHENFHHQRTDAKFNLKIYYPPPYKREVWHYQNANIENIRKAISELPWEKRFANSDVNDKVYLRFLMKQLFVIIGNHLGLILISKN